MKNTPIHNAKDARKALRECGEFYAWVLTSTQDGVYLKINRRQAKDLLEETLSTPAPDADWEEYGVARVAKDGFLYFN